MFGHLVGREMIEVKQFYLLKLIVFFFLPILILPYSYII
jgi:hypothetical protein